MRRVQRWFGRPGRWLAFLAGGVPPLLVFPAPDLSYLAWFALVPGMALFVRASTAREAVARGWWFGAGYLIAMLYWMAPEIGPGLVLVGAVFGGLYSPFAVSARALLRPSQPGGALPAEALPGGALPGRLSWGRAALALVVVPSCWLLPEWVRSYPGLGGPWDLYGASQWRHPAVLALAAIGGVWLVSVALVMANVALMIILITATSAERGAAERGTAERGAAETRTLAERGAGKTRALAERGAGETRTRMLARGRGPRPWGVAAVGVAAFIAAAGAGPLAFALTPPPPPAGSVAVALVQPGVIADPGARADASETLTRGASRDDPFGRQGLDLVVWGESSVNTDLTLPSARPVLRRIEALSAAEGAEILLSQDATPPGKGHEKWGVLVSPSGIKGIYVKTRLVPFGEYIPFRQQLGWLTSISRAAGSNMVPGAGAHPLNAVTREGRPLPIGVLTCFESAFPDMSRVDADSGARLLVYQSATSTFQGTWGPDQHASLAALRAAETGRPAVQASLTGDSVAFDARGRERAWLGQSSRGVVTVRLELSPAAAWTFYDRHGDYVMWSGVTITVVAALLMVMRRRGFLGGTAGGAGDHEAEYGADTGQPVVR